MNAPNVDIVPTLACKRERGDNFSAARATDDRGIFFLPDAAAAVVYRMRDLVNPASGRGASFFAGSRRKLA